MSTRWQNRATWQNTLSLSLSHTPPLSHHSHSPHTHTLSQQTNTTHTRSLTHHTLSLSHTHSLTHTHTLSHTHTHSLTHTLSLSHTHSLSLPLSLSLSRVELYCHSATCVDIQWNEMSCLAGPRCYINKQKYKHTTLDLRTIFDLHS